MNLHINAAGEIDAGPGPEGSTPVDPRGSAPYRGRAITAAALSLILRWHVTWWEIEGPDAVRASLAGANLVRANLDGANLDGANLDGANLDGANLDGANLARASLARASLARASLDGANLDGANLVRANLDGANLARANLDGASLGGASLGGANLDGASLAGASLVRARDALTIGPIGAEGRLIYAVRHPDGPRIQAGCFWGAPAEIRAAIAERYADGTGRECHRASYLAAIDMIEAWAANGERSPTTSTKPPPSAP